MRITKVMKRAAFAMSMIMAVGMLAGCGSTSTTTAEVTTEAKTTQQGEESTTGGSDPSKVFKIGVVQFVEHNALDASYEGFIAGLKDAGYEDGKNIVIDYNNAQNEQANCTTIANKLVNNKEDLIFAIATPAAQAVANKTKDIPVLVTAVTDPADAGLVKSNAKPETNVSGTSDLTPVKEQMALLKEIFPDAKKVAMLYCSSEANSKFQVDLAKEAAKELGMETMDKTVSNSNEIKQVVQSLAGKVDAIYAPTDNMIAAGMATVSMVATDAGIPIICGEAGMVDNGGLATIGIDYFELGKQTAAMAVRILENGEKPADMPVEYLANTTLKVNEEIAAKLKITLPQSVLDKLGN